MVDNAVTTLVPEKEAAAPLHAKANANANALFDSIAHDHLSDFEESEKSALQTFFSVLLVSGYTVAVLVAFVLVWSAAAAMIKTMAR